MGSWAIFSSITPQTARKLAYGAGMILVATSLAFVAAFALRNWAAIDAISLRAPSLLAASALVYAVSHLTTALSWPVALRAMGQRIPLSVGIRTGLVAQVGKYLPGNIAHYAGRAAIAADAGVPVMTSGVSTGVEMLAAILAAIVVAGLALLVDPAPITFLGHQLLQAASLATALTFLVVTGLAVVAVMLLRGRYPARVLLGPMICLGASFLLAGLSFSLVVSALTSGISPASMITVFVLAWVAGFIVPGAPAGLGIREAILIAFLSPMIGSGHAVACSILHRLMTAVVDAAAALTGYFWLVLSKKKKSANDVLSRSRMSSG